MATRRGDNALIRRRSRRGTHADIPLTPDRRKTGNRMLERYFEDFHSGDVLPLGEREITKDEIIAYASVYDAQPFHIDEEAAKKLMLGGLAASGWHTACVGMRMNYDSWLKDAASLGAPGIDELRWVKPVRPGDRLSGRLEITETRTSKSRPDSAWVGRPAPFETPSAHV